MYVVILAGGYGTRISEESHLRPKPMVEIGDRPILWHIMKSYSHYGFNDFIICLGYKGYYIKEYFAQYYLHHSDVTFDFTRENAAVVHENYVEPWRVTLVDTGLETMTGGRVKAIERYIGDAPFMLTYGDGVCDVNLKDLLHYHQAHGKLATVTAVRPPSRYGVLDLAERRVTGFNEKPRGEGGWINGGFFVMEPGVLDYIDGRETVLEQEPLGRLASDDHLVAYKHDGFWHSMDTLHEKQSLEKLWQAGAPWKSW